MEKQIFVSQWLQDEFRERGRRESVENVRRLKREVKIRERICTACTFGSFTLMFLGAGTLEATEAATSPLGIGMMVVGAAVGIVPVIGRWIRGE
jgi:hypothetical protein